MMKSERDQGSVVSPLKIHKKIEKNNAATHCSLPVLCGADAERPNNKNTLFFKFSAGH
jgi:hypothetical protein